MRHRNAQPALADRTQAALPDHRVRGLLENACREYRRRRIGLEDQGRAQLFGDERALDRRTPQAARILRQRQCEPAQIGEVLPLRCAEGWIGRGNGAANFKSVVLRHEAADAFAQHGLFFGQVKVHG